MKRCRLGGAVNLSTIDETKFSQRLARKRRFGVSSDVAMRWVGVGGFGGGVDGTHDSH